MVKDNIQILITGEYWHSDFSGLTSSSAATITLCPLEKLQSLEGPQSFDLVVITQGRRGVVSGEDVEHIQTTFALHPKSHCSAAGAKVKNVAAHPGRGFHESIGTNGKAVSNNSLSAFAKTTSILGKCQRPQPRQTKSSRALILEMNRLRVSWRLVLGRKHSTL